MASNDCVLFIESNTSGTGALFIARAVHLGLEPILLSKDPNRYSFAKPQNGLVVIQTDTTDFSGLEEVCARLMQERRILGVTSSSEYYVPVAARLAASLGFPGSDPATTARCRSKANQRRVLTECADVNPAFHVATTVSATP
jgi:S-sulfo-L-cysteine synthase (3-phospho-L-serine-dependent)